MLDLWLIIHFIGLALGVGAGLAMFRLRSSVTDLPPAERGAFMQRASVLSKNSSVGLLLLIVSGVGLLLGHGVSAVMVAGGPMFHTKLTLVVILIGAFGYSQVLMKKARSGDAAAAARLPMISNLAVLLGISIIITAVLAFH